MPVPPPTLTAPYPVLNDILNTARVRINDAIASLGGDILTNVQPFTQQMTNIAWKKLQNFLANLGYSRLTKTYVLYGVPSVQGTDPAVTTYLEWAGFFDGVTYWPNFNFPQDAILPLWVQERHTNTQMKFFPMEWAVDGLPDDPKMGCNRWFDWQNDKIYMPGSLYSMDLRIKYAAYLPDFENVGTPPDAGTYWYDLPVPIMRSEDALSYFIAAEAAAPRADLDAGAFLVAGQSAAREIFNREAGAKQRVNLSRRGFSRSIRGRGNYGT